MDKAHCQKCGEPLHGTPPACQRCDSESHRLRAESGDFQIVGQPVGTVIEGQPDHPEGRRVDSRPASGGRSLSETAADGSFQADLTGSLERGEPAEPRVIKTLAQALRQSAHEAYQVSGARNDRGQDALLVVDGQQIAVQVTTIPQDQSLWMELSVSDEASIAGGQGHAVQIVRTALEHKAASAAGTLLALDASHIGAVVGPKLVQEYLRLYGDPCIEFSFAAVWVVGPTVVSTIRLG